MAISRRSGLGLMANGCLDMASISRSHTALPKAQSGVDFSIDRIASGFRRPAGNANQAVGDDSILNRHFGGKNAILRNAEVPHAGADDPLVRRRHSPDIAPRFAQTMNQLTHLRENVRGDSLREVLVTSGLHDFFAQSAVHCHHFSAHDLFGNIACSVLRITRSSPAHDRFRYQASLQFPGKKSFARVSGPERTVAVECREKRIELRTLSMNSVCRDVRSVMKYWPKFNLTAKAVAAHSNAHSRQRTVPAYQR